MDTQALQELHERFCQEEGLDTDKFVSVDVTANRYQGNEPIAFEFTVYAHSTKVGRHVMGKGATYEEAVADFRKQEAKQETED